MSDGRAIFDEITLVCNGCRGERVFYPDAPLVGAEALIHWMKTKATACTCGAATCDVKARVRNAEVLR